MIPQTYYVRSETNVRSCPRTECDAVAQLPGGAAVTVIAVVNGEAVNAGNPAWYRIESGSQEVYIYSDRVTLERPTPRPTSRPVQQQAVSTPVPPPVSTPVQQQAGPVSLFGCNGQDDLNCSDFRAIGQNANAHLAVCGDEDRLDQDGDGRACER